MADVLPHRHLNDTIHSKGTSSKAVDPFQAENQGTVDFKQPDKNYGDTYTDYRPRVKAVAKHFRDSGYNVGTDGQGTWTVKGKRKPNKGKPGR